MLSSCQVDDDDGEIKEGLRNQIGGAWISFLFFLNKAKCDKSLTGITSFGPLVYFENEVFF